jgi:acyl-CoA synthetase (AMP-forming)/AMP-acid ligase II
VKSDVVNESDTRSANVAELFAATVARRPDAVALIEGVGKRRRAISFRALDAWARQIAATLQEGPVSRGNAVLFFAAPSIELYAAVIAVLRLGAVAMFIEPSAGMAMIDRACAMHPPRAFVGSPRAHLLRLVSPAMRRIPRKYVTRGWVPGATSLAARATAARVIPMTATAEDDPALLTFTSGSTGRPKGAVRSHGILRAQLDALTASVAAAEGTREMVSLPIVVLLNLANGAETILPDADLRRPSAIDPAPVLDQLAAEDATRVTASPAFLERLADGARNVTGDAGGRARMREIVTGGGPVFPDIVQRIGETWPMARITSVYGSTEAEPIAHIGNDEWTTGDLSAMRSGAGLLTGAPDRSVRLAIIAARWGAPLAPMSAADLASRTQPPSEPGEIVVTGAHVVRGYLGGIGDEETKFTVDGVVWHRTGDVGYLDERGRLWLLGRADAVIEDARGTLHPFAVECAARELLDVRRVAAAAHDGKRLLILEARTDLGAEARRAALDALAWAQLDEVVTWRKLPMDRRHNSKVDYPALRRRLATLSP